MSLSASWVSRPGKMAKTRHGKVRVPEVRAMKSSRSGHQQLQFVVASLHLLGRIGREVAPEGLAARGVVEVHARVVLQVGLGDDDFRRSGVCQDGRKARRSSATFETGWVE